MLEVANADILSATLDTLCTQVVTATTTYQRGMEAACGGKYSWFLEICGVLGVEINRIRCRR